MALVENTAQGPLVVTDKAGKRVIIQRGQSVEADLTPGTEKLLKASTDQGGDFRIGSGSGSQVQGAEVVEPPVIKPIPMQQQDPLHLGATVPVFSPTPQAKVVGGASPAAMAQQLREQAELLQAQADALEEEGGAPPVQYDEETGEEIGPPPPRGY